MEEPMKKLYNRSIPTVNVVQTSTTELSSTKIEIIRYNSNERDKFTHEQLKDYILWFTKMGSFELFFDKKENINKKLSLKGLNRNEFEIITFGHSFPKESQKVDPLFEQYPKSAPEHYCKRFIRKGHLKNAAETSFDAIFSVEGNKVKLENNPMIKRQGAQAQAGDYTVAERYGIWLAKDFIPVQRKNEWVNYKGSEYVKLHAFFNCQGLRLTANRGSIDNTPSKVLADIKEEIEKIYQEITSSDDWGTLSWLEEEASSYKTIEKEKKDFDFRVKKVNKSNIANFQNIILVEPQRESGVFALVVQLKMLQPALFPFYIIDYDTHSGIDVIVKADSEQPIYTSKLYYVEFKFHLTEYFNHAFDNLQSIICWDIDIKHNEVLKDIKGEERKLQIIQPKQQTDYTKYFLGRQDSVHKIEVFVLKDYLKQKLNIDFRPRTNSDVL